MQQLCSNYYVTLANAGWLVLIRTATWPCTRQRRPLASVRLLGGNRLPRCERTSLLAPLLDLTAAVDDEGYFFAVFRRLNGDAFGGGFDVSDLRISGGFKLGYKLLLGQGMGRREDANQDQKKRLRDCSCQHGVCSLARRTKKTYAATSTPIRYSGSIGDAVSR